MRRSFWYRYLIDYAKDQIVLDLDSGLTNVVDFEKRLRVIMREVYKKDFNLYPVDRQSGAIQLLVGVQFTDESNASSWLPPTLL